MLDMLLKGLVGGSVIPGFGIKPGAGNASVTISIPKDHPKADKLIELAQLLATQKTLPSGIAVDRGKDDFAVEKFIALMREIVGSDTVGYLMSELSRQSKSSLGDAIAGQGERLMQKPAAMGHLVEGVLKSGVFSDKGMSLGTMSNIAGFMKQNDEFPKNTPIDVKLDD